MHPEHAAAYAAIADQIEAELRRLGLGPSPAPRAPVTGAFGSPSMTFGQWLEHVLCPRLRAVASGAVPPPAVSSVAAQAVRELDGFDHTDALIAALSRLDALTNAEPPRPAQP
jgi:uncharacterized protein YqcC (DUF446 family)